MLTAIRNISTLSINGMYITMFLSGCWSTHLHTDKYLKILTLFRNVCAHNERLYSFRIQIDFPDTILHAKLGIPKKRSQYLLGKRDLFGLLIAFRYLLPRQDFLQFKHSFICILNKYTKSSHQISEVTLLGMMGFPSNWKGITKYRI